MLPLWFSLCESFSACSQVCCRRCGVGPGGCFSGDARVSKTVRAPVLKLDLLTQSGQDSLFAFLNLHTVVAVRVSRPCRTTCRSQDKERSLRSEAHSAGVPSLQAQQLTSVQQANALISFFASLAVHCQRGISFCASLAVHCPRGGILFPCGHPARSSMWVVPAWRAAVAPPPPSNFVLHPEISACLVRPLMF